MRARIASAPAFRYPRPDEPLLEELVAGYTHITGDPVRLDRPAKRNLIATCYRVHGDAFLPLVQRLFAKNGTAANLLGEIRCLGPSKTPRPAEEASMDTTARTASEPLPGLIHSAENRPRFDPTSRRRYDRHPSNPDAAGFFAREESEATLPAGRAAVDALTVEDDYPRSAWDPFAGEERAPR